MVSINPTVICTAGAQRSLRENERYAVVYRPHDPMKSFQKLDQVSTKNQSYH